MAGTALYELTGTRALLFFFPNVFTFFFIWCAGSMTFRPTRELTPRRTATAVAVVLMPTMALEYALHYGKWFDNLVAVEIIEDAVRAVLRWLRDPLR